MSGVFHPRCTNRTFKRRQRIPGRLVVTAAVSALTLSLAPALPAVAESGGGMPPVSTPVPPLPETRPDGPLGTTRSADDSGLTKDQQTALAAARSKAAASGSPVQVGALTTQTATVQANPSGTVTWTTSLLPERVRQNNAWVPVDATLEQNDDGSYSPKASAEPLTFSGGGSTPLVSMTSDKAQLAFSWPQALPRPTVSGAVITYPDVLKDVDLELTANTLGGFSELIVVKTAQAAANPALATLNLATHATGVTVSDDGHDNLQAATPAGQVMFSAPQPCGTPPLPAPPPDRSRRPTPRPARRPLMPLMRAALRPAPASAPRWPVSPTTSPARPCP